MEVECCEEECVIDTSSATKLDFSVTSNEALTIHTNSIKVQETNLVAQAVQSISSMVTLTPESALANPGLPFGSILSMASPGINGLQDQVVLTLQPMNGGGLLDIADEDKSEMTNSVAFASAAAGLNGPAQLVNGNLQAMVNMHGLQGFGGVPQMAMMGLPAFGGLNACSQLGNGGACESAVVPANNSPTEQTSPSSSPRAMPQSIGMPHVVFSGGQLVQGINGSQYLIQAPPGMPMQQFVTIPMHHMNPSQQIVQYMMPNGQLVQTICQQPVNASAIQQQSVMSGASQNLGIPQILTNSSGQILAVSPQLINQPPNLVQLYNPASQMETDHATLAKATAETGLTQTHIQVSTVGDTSQIQNHEIQSTSPTQIVQVAETSSPSITSTESTTPICQTSATTVSGVNLEEIKEFARLFKMRRLTLGLTQTQVGQALNVAEGPAYSQSAICRFEKLDITPKSAQKIKPVLERWMKEAEERYKNGAQTAADLIGTDSSKKRKKRTSFTPQALQILGKYFDKNPHPTGAEMSAIARKLHYEREVVRVWFCNKRQTLRGTGKRVHTVSPE